MKRLHFILSLSIGIKRWLALFALGILVSGLGFATLLSVLFQGELRYFFSFVLGRQLNPVEVVYTAGIVLIAGIILVLLAFRYIMDEFFEIAGLPEPDQAMDTFLRRRLLARGPRIVAIGGGTGLPIVLQGIKHFTSNITAIVTVADDGGSSGKLREDFGMLPPGDIRNCLLALAERETQLEGILRYRFAGDSELSRHSLGNLFLTALTNQKGDFLEAVTEASRLLAIQGKVVPMSLENVHLVGKFADGTVVKGESSISKVGVRIKKLSLDPPNPAATADALTAIFEADLVIYAPGSLFTSLIPNLLVPEIRQALALCKAPRVLVCNTMTQPGETESFSEADHVRAVIAHAGKIVDYAIINDSDCPSYPVGGYGILTRYRFRRDCSDIEKMGISCVFGSVADLNRPYRHDSRQLAKTINNLFVRLRPEFKRYLWFDDTSN